MECVVRIAAVAFRLRQRFDDVNELAERAGPAVGQQQRLGIAVGGALVNEMQPVTVE